jgi:hypothetical protein
MLLTEFTSQELAGKSFDVKFAIDFTSRAQDRRLRAAIHGSQPRPPRPQPVIVAETVSLQGPGSERVFTQRNK